MFDGAMASTRKSICFCHSLAPSQRVLQDATEKDIKREDGAERWTRAVFGKPSVDFCTWDEDEDEGVFCEESSSEPSDLIVPELRPSRFP